MLGSYDVVVIGGGTGGAPAGIAAAWTLAKSGARVAIIDRRTTPGGKACCGALTSTSWPRAGIAPLDLPDHALALGAEHVERIRRHLAVGLAREGEQTAQPE